MKFYSFTDIDERRNINTPGAIEEKEIHYRPFCWISKIRDFNALWIEITIPLYRMNRLPFKYRSHSTRSVKRCCELVILIGGVNYYRPICERKRYKLIKYDCGSLKDRLTRSHCTNSRLHMLKEYICGCCDFLK